MSICFSVHVLFGFFGNYADPGCLTQCRLKRNNLKQFPLTLQKCLSTTHFQLHNPRMERLWLRLSRQNCWFRAIDDYPICLAALDFCTDTAPCCECRHDVYKDTSYFFTAFFLFTVKRSKHFTECLQLLRNRPNKMTTIVARILQAT